MKYPISPTIHLDYAATTPPDPLVTEAVCNAMRDCAANPSAAYSAAGDGRALLRQARNSLSALLDCVPQELFFTSGGTEANNWALRQAAGRHVVLSAIEHKSVLLAAENQGCQITLVPPGRDGVVCPARLEAALRPETALLSVQLVNNETGAIQPVEAIGQIARARGVLFHCDAVQGFGQLPLHPAAWGIDLLSASAHKLYGPRGVGLLYARQGVKLLPLLAGGGQENGRRAGTENVAGIHGFGVAAQLALQDMAQRAQRQTELRTLLVSTLQADAPGVIELCAQAPRIPAITSLLLPGLSSEAVIARLDLQGIEIAGGAACASREGTPSHVLRAMGLTETQAKSVVRVSTGRHTTSQEIALFCKALLQIFATESPHQ